MSLVMMAVAQIHGWGKSDKALGNEEPMPAHPDVPDTPANLKP